MTFGTRTTSKENSGRRYVGGGPRPDNRKIKQEEASKRAKDWASLTPKQQLEALDLRLGKGMGAKKQRAKLQTTTDRLQAKKPMIAHDEVHQVIEEEVPKKIKAKDRREQQKKVRPGS